MTRYICDRCRQWVEAADPAARVTHDCGPGGKRRRLRPARAVAGPEAPTVRLDTPGDGRYVGTMRGSTTPEPTEVAWDRAETDPCEKGTPGCSVHHTGDTPCQPW